ncbi:MAG: hypothetical protein ACFFDF_01010 [Candidatus Odinarchaeota archaeon]
MKDKQVSNKKKGIAVKIIIIIAIVSLIYGASIYFIKGSNTGTKIIEPQIIDLSFSNWEITGEYKTSRRITDQGTYMQIYDAYYGDSVQAVLDINNATELSFSFSVNTPDISKDGACHIELMNGEDTIILITRRKMSGNWYVSLGAYILLVAEDTNWHDIDVYVKINAVNSIITISVDGSVLIDSNQFTATKINIDSIRIRSAKYYVTSLTWIKLKELIKIN